MFLKFRTVIILFIFASILILHAGTAACVSGNSDLYPATACNDGIISCIVIGVVFILLLTIVLFYIIRHRKELANEQIISRSIIENADAAIIICDSEGKVILVNKFADCRLWSGDAEGKRLVKSRFLINRYKKGYECKAAITHKTGNMPRGRQ